MSQPKRYDLFVDTELKVQKGGEWVQYSDYAALAAELERMRSEHEVGFSSVVLKKWATEHAALAAENERLRKAGDAMYRYVGKSPEHSIQMDKHDKSKRDWLAAKEGGRK